MIFHTYGNKADKAVILIHGMLTPWQIWNCAAEAFEKDHYVVVPELDGHTEDEATVFNSVDEEADKICEYIRNELEGKVYLLAGLSMGGRIAAEIAKCTDISIQNLVLDGAPLTKMNGLMKSIFKKNYISIINKSRARDPKVLESAKKGFLPEERIEDYLKIADNMEPESISRIIDTVFADYEYRECPKDMRILFMHGAKGNEAVSRKCALRMKAVNPQTEIREFKGMAHAELACFKPEQWVKEVEGFLS